MEPCSRVCCTFNDSNMMDINYLLTQSPKWLFLIRGSFPTGDSGIQALKAVMLICISQRKRKGTWKMEDGKMLWARLDRELFPLTLARGQSHDHTSCEGGWEMWSSPVPKRKRRWVLWWADNACDASSPPAPKWKRKSLSHVRLFVTPWKSMEFSRPEYWNG